MLALYAQALNDGIRQWPQTVTLVEQIADGDSGSITEVHRRGHVYGVALTAAVDNFTRLAWDDELNPRCMVDLFTEVAADYTACSRITSADDARELLPLQRDRHEHLLTEQRSQWLTRSMARADR
jgi:hypothetical protein